jgi:hypothetical protein
VSKKYSECISGPVVINYETLTVIDGGTVAVGSASVRSSASINALVVDAGFLLGTIGSVDTLERVAF